jgi:hypothetical protein
MINLKIGTLIAAAFIAGAFVASPELRAYAANTVGSADIINESVTVSGHQERRSESIRDSD